MARVLDYRTQQPPKPGGPPAWWRRGSSVALVGGAAVLAIVFAYAGPSQGLVLYRLVMDGLFLLLWLLSATGLGAGLMPPLVRERSGLAVRLVTFAAGGLGVMSLCVLGLGLAGMLGRVTAFALLVPGFVLGPLALWNAFRDRRASSEPSPPADAQPRGGWAWLWLLAVPFGAFMVTGAMVPPGMLWRPDEPHGYDVAEYHLQVPREWYEAGSIAPLKHNAFSYMPLGAETHYLLAMHLAGGPWAGMYLAQLMHATMVALSVAAVAGFAGRWTNSPARAALAGVAAAVVPWLAQLGAIAFNEGGLLLYGTLALGWAIDATWCPGPRGLSRFVLAGAMAGFACGAKLTAVPVILMAVPAVAGVVMILMRFLGRPAGQPDDPEPATQPLGGGLVAVAAFPLVGALLFAPWLVRNLAWTGNPVFPEGTALFGKAHFSDEQVERWNRAHGPRPDQKPMSARAAAAWHQILASWQFGYVLVPLSLAAAVLARREPRAWFLLGFVVLLAVFWLGFTHLQSRFFVMAVPACALLLAFPREKPWLPVAAVLVAVGAAVGFPQVHSKLHAHVGGEAGAARLEVLGRERLEWLMEASVPQGFRWEDPQATLALVGEARAFWYPLPMSRLRYRTIFDADTSGGRDVLEAWTAGWPPTPGERILVDPRELERFARTYQPFPDFPEEWTNRPEWRAGTPFFLDQAIKAE